MSRTPPLKRREEKIMTRLLAVAIASLALAGAASRTHVAGGSVALAHDSATCAGLGGIEVHGQHIVGDYVSGLGGIGGGLEWPPAGGAVGEAIGGNGGAVVPGGPGPGFHFIAPPPGPFAPGASFCIGQAQSPGTHF
jgi:hypothetical protein